MRYFNNPYNYTWYYPTVVVDRDGRDKKINYVAKSKAEVVIMAENDGYKVKSIEKRSQRVSEVIDF